MTGWETFSRGRLHGPYGEPTVSITAARQIHINASATYLLGDATRAELLWDAERRCIGLRPASETTPHSYALTSYSKGSGRQVSGYAFVRHHGLQDLRGQSFPAHMEGDVLVVPLAPATDAGTEARS